MNPDELKSKLTNGTPLTGEEAKYLIDLVERYEDEVRKAVEAERKSCIAVVDEYEKKMSELHEDMIATSHEDSKMMLAYDMHSRLIAIKHIKEKMKAITPITSNQDRV